MNMTGYPCTYLRRYANRDRPFDQPGRFQAALNIAPNAEIVSLSNIDPHDYAHDGWLEMTVRAPRYARGEGDAGVFRLPMMRHPFSDMLLRDLFYGFSQAQREHALRMRATRRVLYEETITLPEGWTVVEAPAARRVDSESATLGFEISPGEGALTYRFDLALKDHIIAPEHYGGFKEVIDAMLDIGDAWIVCHDGQSAADRMATRSSGAAGGTDQ
jgi:hypothetical protein